MEINMRNSVAKRLNPVRGWVYCHAARRAIRQAGTAVLVHSPGKVGSSTVYEALTSLNRLPVFHTHNIATGWEDEPETRTLLRRTGRSVHGFAPSSHLTASLVLSPLLATEFEQTQWRIITLTRDPIARNISGYFQAIRSGIYALPDARRGDPVEAAVEDFLRRYEHHRHERWFETELRQLFGVDVMSGSFDASRGWQINSVDNVSVLVIRLEDLPRVGQEALEEFLGLSLAPLGARNRGEDLPHSDLYGAVRDRLITDPAYRREMYDTPYCRLFYPDRAVR